MKADSPGRRSMIMENDGSIMRGTGQGLLEFLDWAKERGELNPTTAGSYRSTAKNVLAVESAEVDSIELRTLDVDNLLDRHAKLNKLNFSEASLETYRSRFRSAVAMYLAWLDDDSDWKAAGRGKRQSPTNGSSAPTRRGAVRRAKSPAVPSEQTTKDSSGAASDTATAEAPAGVRLMTYDVPLRPDLIVRVTLPIDLTTSDAQRLATFVNSLAFSGETKVPETREPEGGG
jgi:hypothetical protein